MSFAPPNHFISDGCSSRFVHYKTSPVGYNDRPSSYNNIPESYSVSSLDYIDSITDSNK